MKSKNAKGIYLPLSPSRRMMWDLLEAAQKIPQATVSRRMNLRDLVNARNLAEPRPSWNSMFTKAYATTTAATPELRRLFVRWPWARLYEHPENVTAIAIEAEINGEKTIVGGHVKSPEKMALLALDQAVIAIKHDPAIAKWHRRAMRLAFLPRFLRASLWTLALDWSGGRRARILGTLGVTSIAFAGGHDAIPLTALGNILHYGIVDPQGNAWVRITFDHRVMDGAVVARALVMLEQILNTDILAEVRGLPARAAA